ncbi:hypothetical protein FRB90_002087 [Tulasnella sp. 427]|nr:hypothetical protein FRB90_002087 [Tulasnella sp. 427]
MSQPTQVLPYWLSASTTFVTTDGTVYPTTVVVNLPLTYYGPSIPLGPGWVYGGSTSPPPGQTLTSATEAASSAGSETPSPSGLTSGASETGSASLSPSSAMSTGIPISATSGASSSVPSESSSLLATWSPSATPPITSLSPSQTGSTSGSALTTFTSCTTLGACPTATSQASSNHRKLSTGAIVAISLVSAIVAAALLACCIFFALRRRRRRYPNRGSPLEGNIAALPPPLGDEHGSLLAGRRSGGESPELGGAAGAYRDAPARNEETSPEEEDLSHLPIANRYITERRNSGSWASRPSSRAAGSVAGGRDGGRGTYHAIGDPEAAPEGAGPGIGTAAVSAAAGVAAATAAHQAGEASGSSGSHAHTHSSRGLFYGSGSNGEDHRPGSPTSRGSHDNAEVVTAQRATRSPLARLARLSWFTRSRNTAGSSMAATGLRTDSDDEGGWVNVGSSGQPMRQREGQPPLTTPLLSQPRSGGGRIPAITRHPATRSNTAVVDSSGAPPPVAYFNVPRSRNSRRTSGQSVQTMQSGQTVFYDAEEGPEPSAPAPAFMPRTSNDAPRVGLAGAAAAGGAFHAQRSSQPPSGSDSSRGEGGPTYADFPQPPSGLSPSPSYQWPQFRNGDDSGSPSGTTESPIPPGQALPGLFSRSLSGVGMSSFVDTPRVVDQSEVASLRGDVHSSYNGNGTHSNRDSSYPSRNGPGDATMATHSSFSTQGVQRRMAPTPNREPSLSAIGGARPWSVSSAPGTASASDSGTGTGTGTGSGTGGSSSAQQSPQSARMTQPRLTEIGELRPPQRAAVPPSLSIVGERMRPSIDTPPPPPSANPHLQGLSPPPPRPWWRPGG